MKNTLLRTSGLTRGFVTRKKEDCVPHRNLSILSETRCSETLHTNLKLSPVSGDESMSAVVPFDAKQFLK